MNDIMDLHTHTTASGHAYSTLSEMIRAAADRKLALYGCSDHGPKMAGTTHPSYFINFRVIPRVRFGVHVLMGAELNIMDTDGRVDLPPSTLAGFLDYTSLACTSLFHSRDPGGEHESLFKCQEKPGGDDHRPSGRQPLPHRL